MSAGGGVLAKFAELDATVSAIARLRAAGLRDMTVFTPAPRHELEHALHPVQSPVRIFTLVGGLTGAATGFALAIGTSLDWPLVTGGKPIVSLPPFVIIGFEMTILFGALATVLGLIINAFLSRRHKAVYDPAFSAGHFGVYVVPPSGRMAEALAILREAGPVEVREHAGEVTRA